jgi:hypothetical protein
VRHVFEGTATIYNRWWNIEEGVRRLAAEALATEAVLKPENAKKLIRVLAAELGVNESAVRTARRNQAEASRWRQRILKAWKDAGCPTLIDE